MKLSGLGTRPWFALSFHRLSEFLDLNFSTFSQSVLFASSGALRSYARPPQARGEDSGRSGSHAGSMALQGLAGRGVLGKFPGLSMGPGLGTGKWHRLGGKTSHQHRAKGLGYRNQPGGQYRVTPFLYK